MQNITEPHLLKFLPETGDTFIDIGAAQSEYGQILNDRFKKIISFDADPRTCDGLIGEKYNLALYNYNGTLQFYMYPWSNQSSAVFDSREKHLHELVMEEPSNVIQVECKTLDSFNFNNVDLIKIDTEGAEIPILEGAIDTLKRNMPVLIIENHIENGYDLMKQILEPLGYEVQKVYDPRFDDTWVYREIYLWLIAIPR